MSSTVSTIWHVSEGRRFPLDLNSTPPGLSMNLNEVSYQDMSHLNPDPGIIHLFLIQAEPDRKEQIIRSIKESRAIANYLRIIIVPRRDFEEFEAVFHSEHRILLLEDTIQSGHLKLIIELTFQIEYYRMLVDRLSRDFQSQNVALEGLIDLARSEMEQLSSKSEAFETLLQFETAHKDFQNQAREAFENALRMKEHEMVSLKNQLQAQETLSDYRDRELALTREALNATERALDLSRKENIDRDRIINALDRLRIYTDSELIELFEENQELRKKLSMPQREQ